MSEESGEPAAPDDDRSLEATLKAGVAAHRAGKPEEAERHYRAILDTAPEHVAALKLLGLCRAQQGAGQEGVALVRRSLELDGQQPDAWFNLGGILLRLGYQDDALAAYRRALSLKPDFGEALHALAGLFERRGQFAEAAEAHRRLASLHPDEPLHGIGLATCLHRAGALEEAIEACRDLIERHPESFDAWGNLGVLLRLAGNVQEAVAANRRALELRPDEARGHHNLGNALMDLGDLAAAEEAYRRALELQPDYASAHVQRGAALLALGRFGEGWDEQAWRWRAAPPPSAGAESADAERQGDVLPDWDGAALGERRLLIRSEPDPSPQVFFASLLSDVAGRGGAVTVECDPRLIPLMARSFEGPRFIEPSPGGTAASGFDLQIALGALPRLFRRSESEFPARRGYLRPDPDRVAELGARALRQARGRRLVGVAWRRDGGTAGPEHSIALERWQPVLQRDDCRFVSLQTGEAAAEIAALRDSTGLDLLSDESLDSSSDLDGLAALIAALDLVITVDCLTADLAGAVGAPTWLLLPTVTSWRWMEAREDSPWYPSMRLFRQAAAGDWGPVIERLSEALDEGEPAVLGPLR